MDGFARSYFEASPLNRTATPDSMGYLEAQSVPMTRFLSDNFCTCDRWFSSLPAGTQPNRLMAWTGTTYIDENGFNPPRDPLFLDWMTDRGVRWRVYHSGLSFFLLLGEPKALTPRFRSIDRLAADVYGETDADFPQVIVVEPSYNDAVRITGGIANDNHAPSPVSAGEVFLRRVYDALTGNPERWPRTLLVITFDEHGGFFDHVQPPLIRFEPPAGAKYAAPFKSLGPRVPGLLVSPLVGAGSVCHEIFDHTSVLQMLADKFTPGSSYSVPVEQRASQGVASLSAALTESSPRESIPVSPEFAGATTVNLGENRPPATPIEQTFEDAAKSLVTESPKAMAQSYPAASQWVLSQRKRPYS
jgi:phospholipase C